MKRFALYADKEQIEEHFEVSSVPDSLVEPNYNIGAGKSVPVIISKADAREFTPMRWGIQQEGGRVLSASSEQVKSDKNLFRAYEQGRCIVPASGFFMWKTTVEDDIYPFFIRVMDSEVIGIAAIYTSWKAGNDHDIHGFTMISTPANDLVQPLGDTMPLILMPQDYDDWLNGKEKDYTKKITGPQFLANMTVFRVPESVNDPANNSPELIQPIPKLRNYEDD